MIDWHGKYDRQLCNRSMEAWDPMEERSEISSHILSSSRKMKNIYLFNPLPKGEGGKWFQLFQIQRSQVDSIVIISFNPHDIPHIRQVRILSHHIWIKKQAPPGWCRWAGLCVLCFFPHIRLPLLNVPSHSICHLVIFNQAVYLQKCSDFESDSSDPHTGPSRLLHCSVC